MNENRTKGENERENIYEQKRKGEEIIVVTASRRRAMKELGRVTFSPETKSGGGSPRASIGSKVYLERKIVLINIKRKKEKNDEKIHIQGRHKIDSRHKKVKNDEKI